ncbi:MAG: thiamine pyrophosphate-binding protein [Armatimonadota bacterium]
MKLADYVADFLACQDIREVFVISGGASLHLIDSIGRHPRIDYICPQHEQAGAMAADAYARVTGRLGAAISTSGPGATNMITGICGAYYDSVPVLYITGQVSTFRLKGDSGVRQMGFQETDVVEMCKPITKYAVRVDDPTRIRYELEKACYLATSGRPGPVLIDLPDNLQREEIEPEKLASFSPPTSPSRNTNTLVEEARECLQRLNRAERPVMILGWGIHLAHAEAQARALIEQLGVPVLPSWATLDLLPSDHPLVVGPFGTHGTRYGNFTVQNADLVLAIGTRLDTRLSGGLATFARNADKIVVDIDPCELGKFARGGTQLAMAIEADAGEFLAVMNEQTKASRPLEIAPWLAQIAEWKACYPICPPAYHQEEDLNPYVFVTTLAEESGEGDTLISDTGCALAWMAQAFSFKAGQRFFHDFNNTAMGYALPASIGASIALGGKPVTCVVGDGSLQMNIQELSTVLCHRLPIKIFLIANGGYSMIQQTQEQWLDARYEASSVQCGLAFPDFSRVAAAYGFETVTITKNHEARERIRAVLQAPGPVFCTVVISPDHRVIPQVRFGRPLEDSEPYLDRQELAANMLIESGMA